MFIFISLNVLVNANINFVLYPLETTDRLQTLKTTSSKSRHTSDIIHNGSHCIRIDYGHNVVEQ